MITRVLAIATVVFFAGSGPVSAANWEELLTLARSFTEAQQHDSAIAVAKQALREVENTGGVDPTSVAIAASTLGICHYYNGEYAEAEPLYIRALAIFEKALGPEHPDVVSSVYNLAELYYVLGRYAEAEPLLERALAIIKHARGPNHRSVAAILNNLAGLYKAQGRSAEAEQLQKRALRIIEDVEGPYHPDVATSLNNLAITYRAQGRYAEAEPLIKRALVIFKKVLEPEHQLVATGLANLALLYQVQGLLVEAEPLYKRALAIIEKALDPDHPDIAQSLNNLAYLYHAQGRFIEAEPLYKRALAISEKALGLGHPLVATSLNNLATLYHAQGRYAEAEVLYKRVLTICENALEPEHPDMAQSLNSLAVLYYAQGRYVEAEPLSRRALKIVTKGQTSQSLWAAVLETYSQVLRGMGRYTEAADLAAQAHALSWEDFVSNSATLSERDALKYSNSLYWSTSNYLSCYSDLESSSDSVTRHTADIILASKGQVSDGMFERQKALIEETDSATVALAQSMKSTRFQLSRLYVEGPGDDLESHRHRLDSLSRIVRDLEADLARQSASYRKRQDYHDVTAERIASLLPASVTLVEYIRYYHRQLEPEEVVPRYLALVMTAADVPKIVDLDSGYEIDYLVGEYRAHMHRVIDADGSTPYFDSLYASICGELYARVWQPIEKLIADGGTVMVAPDGALNIVSFAGLMDSSGRYFIEKYGIHYLSSGRDLIRLQDRPEGASGLLAMGDPDYDAGVSARQHAFAQSDSDANRGAYVSRAVPSRFGELAALKVKRLPASRREVELIVDSWRRHTDEPAVAYFDSAASEEIFKTQCTGNRVLHLATHGFFRPPRLDLAAYDSRRDTTFVGENPLLFSGLVLAGANRLGEGGDTLGTEDGYLTAYEVSSLDLKGTELVVLSACESGLGEVKEGEGVYGLRRAFQMAGARTVVSALWPVSDSVTAETMSQLHNRGNQTLSDRLRELQLNAIAELRARGESDHPFTWAAFIAIGDWR